MSNHANQVRAALARTYTPDQRARQYDKHNARCLELPINRPTRGQRCPYPGGWPA